MNIHQHAIVVGTGCFGVSICTKEHARLLSEMGEVLPLHRDVR